MMDVALPTSINDTVTDFLEMLLMVLAHVMYYIVNS